MFTRRRVNETEPEAERFYGIGDWSVSVGRIVRIGAAVGVGGRNRAGLTNEGGRGGGKSVGTGVSRSATVVG